jgi:hypothetical protein
LRQVLLARASRACFSLPWFNSYLCLRAPTLLLGSQILIRFLLGCLLLLLKGLGFHVVCSTRAPGTHFGVALPLLKIFLLFIDLLWFECEWLQDEAGIVLESPIQKTRGFMIQIALSRWFSERVHQVFGEMTVRI